MSFMMHDLAMQLSHSRELRRPAYLDYETCSCLACSVGLVRLSLDWAWAGCTHPRLTAFLANARETVVGMRSPLISLLERPLCAGSEGDAPRGYC